MKRSVFLIFFLMALSIVCFSQPQQYYQPNPLTRFAKTGAVWVMQYDSSGNKTWVNAASQGWVQAYVAQHGGNLDSASIGGEIRVASFNSVAALKASLYHQYGYKMAITTSYYGDTDIVSGATYIWLATSTAIADNRLVIKPNSVSGAGRWIYLPEDGVYNVRSLGLRGDGSTYNQAAFDSIVKAAIPFAQAGTMFFPSGTYRFKALNLPGIIGTQYPSPIAIRITDRNITIKGESQNTSILLIDSACTGIMTHRLYTDYIFRMEDIQLQAAAKSVVDGRIGRTPSGGWSTNLGDDYIYNGIDCWNQGYFKNVAIRNFSGSAVCIFGDLTTKFIGDTTTQQFYCTPNGPPGSDWVIAWNTPGDFNITYGTTIIYNGLSTKTVGYTYPGPVDGYNYYSLVSAGFADSAALIAGHIYSFQVSGQGLGLIADNGKFDGINNLDNNNGSGLFITGSDGNQWAVAGLSVRENGYWGVYDNSFLGTHFWASHGNNNGTHFPSSVGDFTTVGVNPYSTWVGYYTETGNGPNVFNDRSIIIPGIEEEGHTGGNTYGFMAQPIGGLNVGSFYAGIESWLPANTMGIYHQPAGNNLKLYNPLGGIVANTLSGTFSIDNFSFKEQGNVFRFNPVTGDGTGENFNGAMFYRDDLKRLRLSNGISFHSILTDQDVPSTFVDSVRNKQYNYSSFFSTATSTTLTSSNEVVSVSASGQTISLPDATTLSGKRFTIKLAASGTCTVACVTGGQTIDGGSTYSLTAQWKYVTVVSNGSNYLVIANN